MLYLVKPERWGEKIEEELLAVQMITDSRIIYLRVMWVLLISNRYFSKMPTMVTMLK